MKIFQNICNQLQVSRLVLVFVIALFSNFSYAQLLPLSDSENSGNWELNTDISDEFSNGSLDASKWQVQGENGIYKSNFIGRAPSQFNPNNAIVEDNKLKILTKWEPSFPFSSIPQDGVAYENITTAAVISKAQFHYGYMEIRSKSAKAEITSSFWTTGFQSELDMFETFGDTDPGEANVNWRKRLKFNMISWDPSSPYYLPDGNGPAHTRNIQAGFNTADDFHVYGFEWTDQYIKVYIDGVLHPNGTVLRSVIGEDRWVTNVPYWIWVDSETFPWLGIPEQSDLATPAEYQIDYIRIWDKKNLINTDFFGFDESITIDGVESNWFITNNSTNFLSISNEKSYRWENALKFQHNGSLPNNVLAFAPFKSIDLAAGNYTMSFKVWLEPNFDINNLQIVLDDPNSTLDFDLTGVETGKWIILSQDFSTNVTSGTSARLRVRIRPSDVGNGSSTLYLDDIYINANESLSIVDSELDNTSFKIYPNPIDSELHQYLNISASNANDISIYNINGQNLLTLSKTSDPFKLDIRDLKSGMYFITITSVNNSIETKKLIIK